MKKLFLTSIVALLLATGAGADPVSESSAPWDKWQETMIFGCGGFGPETTMTRFFIASIAALLLTTGTAQADEWQCGPHYVSTFVLHKETGEAAGILAYPFYNRTREDVIKNNLPSGGDEELGLPSKGFRWGYAPHPEFRGKRLLTYRGKPCFQ